MRWMVKLYDRSLQWAQHKHAPRYLAAVSFVEASVFPIPPYFMLAPMVLARPNKAYYFALLATIASVFGGILGYSLGALIFKPVVLPLIEYFGYDLVYQNIIHMFQEHGLLALLLLGLTPLPFKLIAIGAGFLSISLPLFVMVSIFSRGLKFFVVAILIKAGGANMKQYLRLIIGKLGIVCIGVFGLALFVYLR